MGRFILARSTEGKNLRVRRNLAFWTFIVLVSSLCLGCSESSHKSTFGVIKTAHFGGTLVLDSLSVTVDTEQGNNNKIKIETLNNGTTDVFLSLYIQSSNNRPCELRSWPNDGRVTSVRMGNSNDNIIIRITPGEMSSILICDRTPKEVLWDISGARFYRWIAD